MSLLDDAKRLDDVGTCVYVEREDRTICGACGASSGWDRLLVHKADCPSLCLPQIVAVLEASERVRSAYADVDWDTPDDLVRAIDTLVAALKGEEPA